MANPLAKVIRYLVTGGVITASDVQAAIEQIESLLTADHAMLIAHNTRHENGGADQINVAGLSGVLADQQVPSGHVTRHENGGDDQLNVAGLNGLLADLQYAGYIENIQIITTGLNTNYVLQYNGTNWIVTNNLTGVTPGVHESTHISGGSDQIIGELVSPQKAGKIFTAAINITGIADTYVLRYDVGTNTWIAQTFHHAASHESTGVDAIASLPTTSQKAALVGTSGTPSGANPFVTQADEVANILPFLPTVNEKAAMDSANLPSSINPFATLSDLVMASAALNLNTTAAFVFNSAVDKKGTPLVLDVARRYLKASTVAVSPTEKPLGLINVYCTAIAGLAAGSTVFNASGTITPTIFSITDTLTSIVVNDGFGYGILNLTNPVPASVQVNDKIFVTGTASNNGTYYVQSFAGSAIKVTRPFVAAEVGVGSFLINKFETGSVLNITATTLNNQVFTITNIVGGVLTVTPVPVNETSTATIDRFFNDGKVVVYGEMNLSVGPAHNFDVAPTVLETYQYDAPGDHYSLATFEKYLIGEQLSKDLFFVDIRENPKYGIIPVSITTGTYIPVLTNRTIICDSSGGIITINLPAITADWDGKELEIIARVVGNNITVNAFAGDDINGLAALPVISTLYTSYTLIAHKNTTSFWTIK